jgi:cytochrome b6-f complex iron-sulfur subunit
MLRTQRLGPGAVHPDLTRPPDVVASRRRLVRWATLGALAVAGAQAGLAVIRFARPAIADGFGTEIVAATLGRLPPVDGPPLRHQAGRFYLIRNLEGLLAFSWTCTHLGCTVPWAPAEGRSHCPCHQSVFDRQGRVLSGPATRPLDLMPIRIDGERVVVDTGAIVRRADYDAGQVTPLP